MFRFQMSLDGDKPPVTMPRHQALLIISDILSLRCCKLTASLVHKVAEYEAISLANASQSERILTRQSYSLEKRTPAQ